MKGGSDHRAALLAFAAAATSFETKCAKGAASRKS